MHKPTQQATSSTIKSLEDIKELPIPIDEMNDFFDEQVARNGDKIEITPENFPMYSKDSLAISRRKAEDFTLKYEHDTYKKIADLLEKSVYFCAELSEWIWTDVTSVLTSDYDDYYNWVDMIFEFNHTNKNLLWLAVDVTYSKNVAKKFEKLKKDLDKWYLSRVVFYKSDDYSWILENLPKVIIELTQDEVIDLAKKVYLSLNKTPKYKLENGLKSQINEELASSPVQYLIILQSIIELIKIRKYISWKIFATKKQKNFDNPKLLKSYEKMLVKFDRNISILSWILWEKLEKLKESDPISFQQDSIKSKVKWLVIRSEYSKYLWEDFFNWRFQDVEKIVAEFDFVFKKYPKVWLSISENLSIFEQS